MSSRVPVFLSRCAAYARYRSEVPTGDVTLPPYEQGANGVRVYHGEVFCRMPSCAHGTIPFSATNNLRGHVRRHSLAVAPTRAGALTQTEIDAIIAWYVALFAAEEDDEEDDGEEDSEDSEDSEDEDEDEEEDDEEKEGEDDEDEDQDEEHQDEQQ